MKMDNIDTEDVPFVRKEQCKLWRMLVEIQHQYIKFLEEKNHDNVS